MFIETLKTMRLYERQSKLGIYHTFHRKNTVYVFYCDTKKYAQKIGVKMRKVYQLDASSTMKTL